MDASDDAGVDADGPLDPRIQIELENLNNSTDEINKLEIELDEAHTAFRQLLSDSTRRLKEIANKIGTGCIEKARCYYKALEVAQQAQVQCQRQAQLFQRASEIHSAAKETVALAEARFISHQHEWNFDQAWQDMLNHATIKVMDADNQKAECGREHLRRAKLFHDAEKKVQHLEEKHRRAIIKSRPYFEVRAQCDEMLATQKCRVEYLQKGVKKAKDSYASSLRVLEDISNQIHQRRRDYDIMTKGPREPGVGAELISPTESLSYETELDKLSLSRMNSLASSEPDIDERAQDFEDVCDLKQRMEQLSARSVDGSESNASQWELELQASVERLNTLPIRKLNSGNELNIFNHNESESLNFNNCEQKCNPRVLSQVQKSQNNNDNGSGKVEANSITSFKKPLARTDSTKHHQSWNSLTQSPTNSSFNKSETFSTQAFSKSLNNSLVNIGNFIFKKNSIDERELGSSLKNESNGAKDLERREIDRKIENKTSGKKKISVDTSNLEIAEFTKPNLNNTEIEDANEIQKEENILHLNNGCAVEGCNPKNAITQDGIGDRTIGNQNDPENISKISTANAQNVEITPSFGSNSLASTPARHRLLAKSRIAKSYENNLDKDLVECPKAEKPSSKTSSVKELPLLSIIHRFPESRFTKDKSSSMTDLADKQNLKTTIGHSSTS